MHDRISVNSICFLSRGFAEQASFWRSLAADRISLVGPQLDAEGIENARAALATGSYRLETIVHPFLPGKALDPDEVSWEGPRAALSARIELARQWGAKSVYMTTGGHGGLSWEQAASTFAAMVAPCAEQARAAGIALMVENAPPQYADLHIAHSLRDTVTLAELAGIGVCIDLFSCWTEADLKNTIERAATRCDLVQVSDYVCGDRALPARAVPGDGDMPLQRLLGWILDAGFGGAFDLELLGPRIDSEGQLAATDRAARSVSALLERLGA
ncbi:MAG: sugar phosphate isomerase/epimerase [Halioglobus sp.]|nr:sugar phosphate isomerase/epimerase [Halioglobus sp.]